MRIAGLLSWYDESPHWLATAVAGFARVCDVIVAVDGAYRLYPGARPRSHPSQVEAITRTAEALGIGCLVYQPDDVWRGNEVEKRNTLLQLAGPLLREGEDWVLVFDADFHILRCEPELVRATLTTTDAAVATYVILDGKDFLADPELHELAAKHPVSTEWTLRTRDVYRWTPTLRVGPAHWCYSAEVDGERRWLRGPYRELAPAVNLDRALVVYHRTQDRAEERRQAAQGYYEMRERYGVEEIPEEEAVTC